MTYMSPEDRRKAIAAAIAKFPATFGLRAFPGDTFRISETNSYFGGPKNETLMLYTDRFKENGEWTDFAKGTVEELERTYVCLSNQ